FEEVTAQPAVDRDLEQQREGSIGSIGGGAGSSHGGRSVCKVFAVAVSKGSSDRTGRSAHRTAREGNECRAPDTRMSGGLGCWSQGTVRRWDIRVLPRTHVSACAVAGHLVHRRRRVARATATRRLKAWLRAPGAEALGAPQVWGCGAYVHGINETQHQRKPG